MWIKLSDNIIFLIFVISSIVGIIAKYGNNGGSLSFIEITRTISFIGFGMIIQKKWKIY